MHSEGEGRGATFTMRMPLEPLSVEPEGEASGATEEFQQVLRGVSILLVEDDAATREATSRLLQMHGAKVHAVATTVAAQDAFATLKPALIISDIGLPGEDGFALIRHIRSLEKEQGARRVPAVALTAFARTDDQRRALQAGFDAHVAKPVNVETLIAAIQKVVTPQ